MADLRIFAYLPNPRLYKATIAARDAGAGAGTCVCRRPWGAGARRSEQDGVAFAGVGPCVP